MALTEAHCPKCSKQLGFHYELVIEYDSKHWHLSCLLDRLIEKGDNPRLF